MSMNLDFLDIQQISQQYFRNTVMVLTRDIPSLENIQDNMPFSDEDDTTTAYPTYLPVPALVARNIIINSGGEGNKSRVVGYAFLGPSRKSTMDVKNMAMGGDGEGSEAGSVESEASAGSEGSAASYGSYGSQGSEGSQGSQTSVSSAGNDHDTDDDENEDSEDDENDLDDDDDPYGEVEDDDVEFD